MMIFMVGACMFTLGVFVGRGSAPVRFDIQKLQNELAALRSANVQQERVQAQQHAVAIDDETELGFYEALKTTAGSKTEDLEIQANSPPETTAAAAVPSAGVQAAAEQDPKPSGNFTVQANSPPEPAAAAAASAIPSAGVQAAAEQDPKPSGNFTVQVASLREAAAADKVVARLMEKGYPARRIEKEVPGKGVWFRVRVGSFQTQSEAEAALNRLRTDKFQGIVIQF